MSLRKISLVITLLLSVCFVYAQSTINLPIENNSEYDYNIVVGFNQAVTPNAGSSPVSFTVLSGTTYEAEYTFDEDDVNVESVRCAYALGGTPIGNIAINDGTGSEVYVAPMVSGSNHIFRFDTYEGQDDWESLTFSIFL